jgi:hypothetical protein
VELQFCLTRVQEVTTLTLAVAASPDDSARQVGIPHYVMVCSNPYPARLSLLRMMNRPPCWLPSALRTRVWAFSQSPAGNHLRAPGGPQTATRRAPCAPDLD